MSRLQDLIERYCPDGVEYVSLDDACCYPRERVNIDSLAEGMYVSVENLAQDFGGLTGEIATTKPGTAVICFAKGDVLVGNIRPYLKKVWLAEFDGGTNGDVLVFRIKDSYRERLLPEFLYTQLASESFIDFDMRHAKGAKMPRGDKKAVLRYRIPVPPIEVQREVVCILDEYTAAHDELMRQLNKEMCLRKQQLSVARTELFSFSDNDTAEWVPLSELCSLRGRIGFRGYTRADIVSEGDGAISLSPSNIISGELKTDECTYLTWEKYHESPEIIVGEGDILFVKTGSTVGKTAFVDHLPMEATINPQMVILKDFRNDCDARFLAMYLQSDAVQTAVRQMAGIGSVPNISQKKLGTITVPLPPIHHQVKCVKVLGELSSLCRDFLNQAKSDMSLGKEELALVRNQLLSFPEKVLQA